MKKEYAILIWPKKNKSEPTFYSTIFNNILIYHNLEEADSTANILEDKYSHLECRVISLDSVHE